MCFSSATSSRAHRQPADMRAIGFKEYGGPEVLQEWTCPPKPSGPDACAAGNGGRGNRPTPQAGPPEFDNRSPGGWCQRAGPRRRPGL